MSSLKKLNRLIIIGNGFDLAHGYKTSYKDFLFHIIFKRLLEFKQAIDSKTYNKHKPPSQFHFRTDLGPIEYPVFLKRIFAFEEQIKSNTEDLFGQIQEFIKGSGFTLVIPSQLIDRIYNDTHLKNWVDIEEAYFSLVKRIIYHKSDLTLSHSEITHIKLLNDSLAFLTKELEQYLLGCTGKKVIIDDMAMKFNRSGYETTYILNFNYTTTFTQYFEETNVYEVINIHGELGNKNNPIIFGVGDENHTIYPQIVESNVDETLHNVKSLKYLETTNYRALKMATDETLFDIDVIGHSCGISDRTLLKEIFNHTNCSDINIYHHNGLSSYNSSIYGASRYFSNNYEMRQKIRPYNPALTIPQIRNNK